VHLKERIDYNKNTSITVGCQLTYSMQRGITGNGKFNIHIDRQFLPLKVNYWIP